MLILPIERLRRWDYLVSKPIIYFDNAATTYPKPEEVYQAADDAFRRAGNPGRGAHRLALESARAVYETREKAAAFLKAPLSERLIFTPGCTHAINMVLKGLSTPSEKGERPYLSDGDLVYVTSLEHNAVMRPLKQLETQSGVRVQSVPYKQGSVLDPSSLKQLFKDNPPALLIVSHASNVTGEIADVERIAAICAERNVPLLVDAAQTAGLLDVDLSIPGITFWCASAHKSLMGQSGLGLLYVDREWDLEPLIAGGTGSASEELLMPTVFPDRAEPGSVATSAIAALKAGIEWIERVGRAAIFEKEGNLAERFLSSARGKSFIRVFGRGAKTPQLAHLPFLIDGMPADRVADVLDRDFAIAVRPGLHCAAQAHRTLGTRKTGLVRASFGYFNTEEEVDELVNALASITRKVSSAARDEGS